MTAARVVIAGALRTMERDRWATRLSLASAVVALAGCRRAPPAVASWPTPLADELLRGRRVTDDPRAGWAPRYRALDCAPRYQLESERVEFWSDGQRREALGPSEFSMAPTGAPNRRRFAPHIVAGNPEEIPDALLLEPERHERAGSVLLLGADQRSWSLAPDDDATMSPEAITATFAPLPQTLERPAQFTVELRGRGVRAPLAAESRVVRWIVIDGGVRAAVVRSRARLVVADAGVEGSVHWVHEQIVLEDGLSLGWRLDQAWSLRVPELDGVASGTSRAAMRYVGGCSTAGLEPAAAPRLDARVVRARSLLSFVVRAVFLDQRDVGLSFFDASIVQRHGSQVVWAALRRAIHGFFPTGFVVSREGDSDAPMRFSATLTAAPTDLNEPARARVRVEVTQRDAPVITAFDANGLHVDADTLTTPRPDERSPVLGRATGVGR